MPPSVFGFHVDDTRNIAITVLSPKTKNLICNLLNPQMYIPAPNGTLRYWRGLADLCRIEANYEASLVEDSNPTGKILNLWREKDPHGSTLQRFLLFMVEMDRFDVVDDIIRLFDEDIRIYKVNLQRPEVNPVSLEVDKYIITTEDATRIGQGLPLKKYDAFLLYDQDDSDFAIRVLNIMETDYNMKFCDKDRNFVGGGFEMDKIISFMTERCNYVVVILSDSFFKSPWNDYYLKFARAYEIDQGTKIIPCIYKYLSNYPKDMKYLHTLDYRRMAIYNFWEKLRYSISVGNPKNVKVIRSSSDGQVLQSVFQGNGESCLLEPLPQFVEVSRGADRMNIVEVTEQTPINPSPSDDNSLRSNAKNNKRVKNKQKWFKKILKSKRPQIA